MRCPNRKCRRQTPSLLIKVTPKGKVLRGCRACISLQWDRNLYTGRKIWAGPEVDGVEGNREKVHAFGEKIAQRAADMRRRNPLRSVPD